MADVRSMLRQERAARQQTGRPPKQSTAPAAAPSSKKRKATDDSVDERKRTRTEVAKGVPAGFFDAAPSGDDNDASLPPAESNTAEEVGTAAGAPSENATLSPPAPPPAPPPVPPQPLGEEDARDLDAFLQEMEQEPQPQHVIPFYASGAVIEAAPMTAAELAAQAREEQSAQRARREEELEADKEDAARQLEDEFDEMEGLEERVRKLREQRDALRNTRTQTKTKVAGSVAQPVVNEEDESESEDDEDWDDWRFRPA